MLVRVAPESGHHSAIGRWCLWVKKRTQALQQDALVFDFALEAMAAGSVHDRYSKPCQAKDERVDCCQSAHESALDPFGKFPKSSSAPCG